MGGCFFIYYLALVEERIVFKKLKRIFHKEVPEIVEERDLSPEPELKEAVKIFPDTIELPWKEVAPLKNLDSHVGKIHEELKAFLYRSKLTEKKLFLALDKTSNAIQEQKKKLKAAYGIPETEEYDFIFPEATGRSGFFKKKKTPNQ
mgnify:CR=1 FL=1